MPFALIPNWKRPGEMKNFVCSPSNMSNYKDCPRRFEGQTITGEIQWKSSGAKSAGQYKHNVIEQALQRGVEAVTNWPADMDTGYTQQRVQESRQMVADGAQIFVEHEMTINHLMRPAEEGWWDDDAILRAKADTVIIPPGDYPIAIIDIKSGKIWDRNDFQLRIESLIAHLIYNKPVVNYAYWYVDQGDTVDGTIDFRNGLAPVKDIIDQMAEMKRAFKDNYFPAKKNKFCSWCQFHKTPKCGL